jgi:hypothetical protein
VWFNIRACLISLTLSLVASTSLKAGMGVWPFAWCMLIACVVVGLLRNGKSVDRPGIFVPILCVVVGFLLSVNEAGPVWRALEVILLAGAGGYLSGEFESENTLEFSDRLPTFLKYLGIAIFSLWLALGAWIDARPPGLSFLHQYIEQGEERQVILISGVYPLIAIGVIWSAILFIGCAFLAYDWLKSGPAAKK